MAEKTRIWRFTGDDTTAVLEFDFLAILHKFQPGSFRYVNSCEGFVEVEDILGQFPEEYTNDSDSAGSMGMISIKLFSFNYRLYMMKSVSNLCGCYEFKTEENIIEGCELVSFGDVKKTCRYDENCEKCKVKKSTGTLVFATGGKYHPVELNCTVAFLWERNTDKYLTSPCELSQQQKNISQKFIILIDFLPAIEVTKIKPDLSTELHGTGSDSHNGSKSGTTTHEHVCYLVPKGCKGDHNTCWKVSHCEFERQLLQSTSQVHRDCYMALKIILDYILSVMSNMPGIPTTYILKTAVLHHIQSCSMPDLLPCVMDIITFLSNAHENAFLPHLLLNDFNLLNSRIVEKNFSLHHENQSWAGNRNFVLGKCWKFIQQLLENLKTVIPSGFDFDIIQTALKCTTVIYGWAYLKTTFKVQYLPNEEELMNNLCKIFREEFIPPEEMKKMVKVKGDDKNQWEKDLPKSQYRDAAMLYSSMGERVPTMLDEELDRRIKSVDPTQSGDQKQSGDEETSSIIYSRI
ncbi:uncharacterized protein LOC127832342 [Dreissena polymorpha]|uniref:Mab-21-like HhH/H2TH-like domain-containing protein n=1 Tax=Dreissena polymorpha TaxID=45954 RepID=A0A9D4JUD1_DREPO|nr:uncharacterized protein LOC127832342 [Dreissena polymorpha]KAH3820567.1 hypothetical protein DPMN_122311 [Dreissena polymorpha]